MNGNHRIRVLLLLAATALTIPALLARQSPPSLSYDAVTENLVLPEPLQQQRIRERRVNFELTDEKVRAA